MSFKLPVWTQRRPKNLLARLARSSSSIIPVVCNMCSTAEIYDRVQRRHQGKDGKDLIDKLSLRKGSCVLHLGCGTGYLASVVAEKIGLEGTVTGIDPNKERLRFAQRVYGAQNSNLQFLEGSSEEIPGGPYDLVYSNHVVHWIKDKEFAFKNVYEKLKIGGIFAVLFADKHTGNEWGIVRKSMNICSSDVYVSIATKCGFQVKYVSEDEGKRTFDTVDEYIEWISTTLDIGIDTIDSATLEEIKKQFSVDSCARFERMMFLFKK